MKWLRLDIGVIANFYQQLDSKEVKATTAEVKLIVQQTASDVDDVKRSLLVPSSLTAKYLT